MAVATTMRRGSDCRSRYGWMNIYVLSSTGIAANSVLTLSSDLTVTVLHELPNLGWKCRVTVPPPANNRLRAKLGDPVTG
jgi:hypothetical protein